MNGCPAWAECGAPMRARLPFACGQPDPNADTPTGASEYMRTLPLGPENNPPAVP